MKSQTSKEILSKPIHVKWEPALSVKGQQSITQWAIYIKIIFFHLIVSYHILNLPHCAWKCPLHHKCIYLHTPKKKTKPPPRIFKKKKMHSTGLWRLNKCIYVSLVTCSTTVFLQSYGASKFAIL